MQFLEERVVEVPELVQLEDVLLAQGAKASVEADDAAQPVAEASGLWMEKGQLLVEREDGMDTQVFQRLFAAERTLGPRLVEAHVVVDEGFHALLAHDVDHAQVHTQEGPDLFGMGVREGAIREQKDGLARPAVGGGRP